MAVSGSSVIVDLITSKIVEPEKDKPNGKVIERVKAKQINNRVK